MLSDIAHNVAVRPVVSIATTMKNNPVKTTLVAAAAAYAVARTYDVDAINQFEGKVSELTMPYLTSAKEIVTPYVNSTAETVSPYYASVKNTVTNISEQICNVFCKRLENEENAENVGTNNENPTICLWKVNSGENQTSCSLKINSWVPPVLIFFSLIKFYQKIWPS